MKITRDWLERTNHCADGRAWGDIEVGAGGLELEECWGKIMRADWMLSMIVQTKTRGMAWAFGQTETALQAILSSPTSRELARKLPAPTRDLTLQDHLHALRHEAATEAYIALKLRSDLNAAWECEAVALTALALTDWLGFHDEKALEYLQGAWNMLGKAHGHEEMTARLAREAGICLESPR